MQLCKFEKVKIFKSQHLQKFKIFVKNLKLKKNQNAQKFTIFEN